MFSENSRSNYFSNKTINEIEYLGVDIISSIFLD